MKLSAMTLLGITTLLLLTIVIFSAMDFPFSWVFYATCAGQVLLVYTVYKVLTDDYKTDKTFRDFYEDRPDLGR
ncbi:hypothetical protein ACH3O9_08835 [Leeuwenhoekiella sp. A16]|uniref:hypothetical protein n=1 Tax=unclassified Leeuwenhoekiella TaxID=2615029 RepID=UPI000C4FBB5E|nr:hypothetical protein [Cytophagaceae bacterium]|tara:strand:+ start:227 stop:448 length:222 start_codon:yes stop_codon:yes gene_type:complete